MIVVINDAMLELCINNIVYYFQKCEEDVSHLQSVALLSSKIHSLKLILKKLKVTFYDRWNQFHIKLHKIWMK